MIQAILWYIGKLIRGSDRLKTIPSYDVVQYLKQIGYVPEMRYGKHGKRSKNTVKTEVRNQDLPTVQAVGQDHAVWCLSELHKG